MEKARFTRVDSDVTDRLIEKEDAKEIALEAEKREILSSIFRSQLPQINKVEFNVESQALGETASPIYITQSEYMRRMKEMANIQAGMSFYGEMSDMFTFVVNVDHRLVKVVLKDFEEKCNADLASINEAIKEFENHHVELKKDQEGKKDEDISVAEKDEVSNVEKNIAYQKSKKEAILGEYAAKNKMVRQLVDLALLQNNMLKGEALNNFIQRSLELI